jgi:hypothetical protein
MEMQPHWKLNEWQARNFEVSNNILNGDPATKQKLDELVKTIMVGRDQPINIDGYKYRGDVFYDDVFRRVKAHVFSSKFRNAADTYVCHRLKLEGFKLML